MSTERILTCDVCGKQEKDDATGWLDLMVTIHVMSKSGHWWSKYKAKDDWYTSKDFCGLHCMSAYLYKLHLDGTLREKAFKLQKRQKREVEKKKKK